MKILVVDPDAARASTLCDALTAAGAQPAIAPSASFALTMLEWNQQDVIVSRARVGDMDGQELCAFVRSDPSTKGVKFVLVAADVTATQAAQLGIDLVIPEGLIAQAIVTRVMHLMRRETDTAAAEAPARSATPPASVSGPAPTTPATPVAARPSSQASTIAEPPAPVVESPAPVAESVAPVAAQAPAPPPPVAARRGAPPAPPLTELEAVGLNGAMRTFQGALGSLTLETLAQAIAAGSKTGRLLIVLGTGGGMIAFDSGRIVHAELGNTTGETAFQTLVAASHREAGGKFCFIPAAPRDLANVPKTITRSVAELLRGAATAMDQER